MTDTKLENRILELEGKIDGMKVALLSISDLLQSVEPRELQRALLTGMDLAARAQMPLPSEIRETAFHTTLTEFAISLEARLEPDQT